MLERSLTNPPTAADFLALKRVVVLQSILFLFCQPERAVEVVLAPALSAVGPSALSSLEVRQIAESGEAERPPGKFLHRDIGERRVGCRTIWNENTKVFSG